MGRGQPQFCLERLTEPSCLHGRALPLYEATPAISAAVAVSMGDSQNAWFIMGNPIQMDDEQG